MTSSSTSPSGITVSLNNVELWEKFHPDQEMIVTPVGRKLFPDLKYDVTGLDKDQLYFMYLFLERADQKTYRFIGEWEEAGKGEKALPVDKKEHKDGGKDGGHWMSKPVSFDYIRITNNKDNVKENCVLVHSMHKYQPVIVVKRHSDGMEEEFRLGMTDFFAVTAYQRESIKELKKSHNKFASGFRENGKHTRNSKEDSEPEQRASKRGKSTVSGFQYPTPPPSTPPNFLFGMDAYGIGYGLPGMMTTPPQAQTPPTFPGQPPYSMTALTPPPPALTPPSMGTSSAQTTPPPQAAPPFFNQFYSNPYGMMYSNPMGNMGTPPIFHFTPNNGNVENRGAPSPFDNFGFQGF